MGSSFVAVDCSYPVLSCHNQHLKLAFQPEKKRKHLFHVGKLCKGFTEEEKAAHARATDETKI